jgi:hypothetical protein
MQVLDSSHRRNNANSSSVYSSDNIRAMMGAASAYFFALPPAQADNGSGSENPVMGNRGNSTNRGMCKKASTADTTRSSLPQHAASCCTMRVVIAANPGVRNVLMRIATPENPSQTSTGTSLAPGNKSRAAIAFRGTVSAAENARCAPQNVAICPLLLTTASASGTICSANASARVNTESVGVGKQKSSSPTMIIASLGTAAHSGVDKHPRYLVSGPQSLRV